MNLGRNKPEDMEVISVCGYPCEDIIGEGLHGVAYLVNDQSELKIIKILRRLFRSSFKETTCSIRFNHPNIVKTEAVFTRLDYEDVESFSYLQEYGGVSFEEYVQTENFNFDLILDTFYDISSAIRFINNNNYIHGDIAFRNIVIQEIDDEGNIVAKLIDFGKINKINNNYGEDIYSDFESLCYIFLKLLLSLQNANISIFDDYVDISNIEIVYDNFYKNYKKRQLDQFFTFLRNFTSPEDLFSLEIFSDVEPYDKESFMESYNFKDSGITFDPKKVEIVFHKTIDKIYLDCSHIHFSLIFLYHELLIRTIYGLDDDLEKINDHVYFLAKNILENESDTNNDIPNIDFDFIFEIVEILDFNLDENRIFNSSKNFYDCGRKFIDICKNITNNKNYINPKKSQMKITEMSCENFLNNFYYKK